MYSLFTKPELDLKEVHIDTQFVLTFSVNESAKTITFEDFDHHDKIFKR